MVCAGSLPDAWASDGAFPSLSNLALFGMPLTGTLPSSWGASVAVPSLAQLQIGLNSLSGVLPAGWGSAASFQKLQQLSIFDTNISGEHACLSQMGHRTKIADLSHRLVCTNGSLQPCTVSSLLCSMLSRLQHL